MLVFRLLQVQPWLANVESALFDLLDFCDDAGQQELIADLIYRTTSLKEEDFSNAIVTIARTIQDEWELDPKSTWIVSSNNKKNTDSSQEVLNRVKSFDWDSTGWTKYKFLTRYREVEERISDGDHVVIVDDFVGSGTSMLKTIDWFCDMMIRTKKTVTLHVGIVAGCQVGLDAISGKGINVLSCYSITKSISDHFKDEKLGVALAVMASLEDKLEDLAQPTFGGYRFGYKASEAMYHRAGGNTPNNVFPIFWWKLMRGKARRTVMHRT
jgi:hypothetical protein